MKQLTCFVLLALSCITGYAQKEDKNWYFGTGTDGLVFYEGLLPVKVNNKFFNVGYEGMVVVNDPITGKLLFYSDGIQVIDKNHQIMANGTGLTGDPSGTQSVQACRVPGECNKYYLFTNSAWDIATGSISYSIIDLTTSPGVVTSKNISLWAGPTDQGMCLVSKPKSNDYWLIANTSNSATYNVFAITASGISAPATYQFNNTGVSYFIRYNSANKKLMVSGEGNKALTLIDFNPTTGALSNETRLVSPYSSTAGAARFSPDCTKIYISLRPPDNLVQYNFTTATWTKMNTCCYAHDLKMAPDGKLYHIHTYNNNQPMAVIDYPNQTAAGNLCGYRTLTYNPPFNGESRIFPEFVVLPDPPNANADSVRIISAAIDVDVLANDNDPQSDPISIDAIIYGPKRGTAIITSDKIRYTPFTNAGCEATDTLIYSITDNHCQIDTARVIFYIKDISQPIFANTDFHRMNHLLPTNFMVTQNDVDPLSRFFRVDSIISKPRYGTVEIIGNDVVRYTVTYTCYYIDTTIYRITAGCVSDTAMMIIEYINPNAPVANSDYERLSSAGSITIDVTANDAGASGVLIDSIIRKPKRGTASVLLNKIQYTPNTLCQPRDTIIYCVKDAGCPGDTAMLILEGDEPVPFTISTNSPLCEGQTLQLSASAYPGAVYGWSGPGGFISSQRDISIVNARQAHSGLYALLASANSCPPQPGFVTVTINALPTIELGNDTATCDSLYLSLPAVAGASYLWNTGDTSTGIAVTASGKYTVSFTNFNNCSTTDSINVTIFPLPEVKYHPLVLDCGPDTLVGPLNEFAAYLWGDGSLSRFVQATTYGVYNLTVTDAHNCVATASIEVKNNCPDQIITPNTFTPNGDGINDVFYPNLVNIQELRLEIYNRWGELLFQSHELNKGWDGTYRGKPCQDDLYVYRIVAVSVYGVTRQQNGPLTLIR